MLARLCIENLVLFEKAQAEFSPKLNVLTGETGAGKSLLLQAIDLALGARSDVQIIRAGADRVQVTAEFENLSDAIVAQLEEIGIESDGCLLVRRIVQADGKHKVWANDVAITQSTLKTIGTQLIQRHSQHDQRGLMDSKSHRALLDAQLPASNALESVRSAYKTLQLAQKDLKALEDSVEVAKREEAYLRVIIQDLSALNPQEGEEVALAEARARYMNLQKNQSALTQALEALEGQHPARAALIAVQKQLSRAVIAPDMLEHLQGCLERAISDIDEVSATISGLLVEPDEDAHSLAAKEDRLFALRAAARKYNVTTEELPGFYQQSRQSLATLDDSTAQLALASKALEAARDVYQRECEVLNQQRAKASGLLVKQVKKELAALNMADAELRIVQSPLPESAWSDAGNVSVVFEIAPNKGQGFGALNKIASGGELSRLLLAISVVIRTDDLADCVIYDEIDAGTSGAVAEAIGVRLKALSAHQQVIAITHLPQVAACADHHMVIEKHSDAKQAHTTLRALSSKEREEELARLISGKVVTQEAKRAATKLLQAAQ